MKEQINSTNFHQVCRLCLENVSKPRCLISIFENENISEEHLSRYFMELNESVPEIIASCIGIYIDPSDGLPTRICSKCENSLIASNIFRRQCLESNELLQQFKIKQECDDFNYTEDDAPPYVTNASGLSSERIKEESFDDITDHHNESVSSLNDSVWNSSQQQYNTPIITINESNLDVARQENTGHLLSKKSKEKYSQVYNNFMQWKDEKNFEKNDFSEEIMLAYFDHLKHKYKASTLWTFYSMLRTSIERNDNLNINYPKLNTFLKKVSVGFRAKKLKLFQSDALSKFLCEAPDMDYLATKVIMIFGIYGASRADELTKIDLKDIKQQGQGFVIKISQTKFNTIRTITLENEYAGYLRKYLNLRPSTISTSRFFINYQKGKCSLSPIGRNKFLNAPKVIAKFLNLQDPEQYTGLSFRSSARMML